MNSYKIIIRQTLPKEYRKLFQLSLTAQICTNGRRYSLEELKEKVTIPSYQLYSVLLNNRSNTVSEEPAGAFGIQERSLDFFFLTQWALGKNVENRVINKLLELDVKKYIFIPNGKNEAVRSILNSAIGWRRRVY